MDHIVSVNLTEIPGARLAKDEDVYTGKVQDGVFIPINAENGVSLFNNNRVYLNMYAKSINAKAKNMSHLLKPMYGKETLTKLRANGYKDTHYVGKIIYVY